MTRLSPAVGLALAGALVCAASCGGGDAETDVDPSAADANAPEDADVADADGEPFEDDMFLPPPEEPTTGAGLFAQHCASCHGLTGDGRGTTELDRPARNFAEGGFSFGNTREALFQTVSAGLPGSNPMPGFAELLEEDERWMLVDHVLTLAPVDAVEETPLTEMLVGERAVIARGILPALEAGGDLVPRGLLVGLPGGCTFEYDAERCALLAVRQGRFADRTDWLGRGGTPLEPLGEPTHAPADAPFAIEHEEREIAVHARFRGTWVSGRAGGLEYDLVDDEGTVWAGVRETCVPPSPDDATPPRRRLELRGRGKDALVRVPGDEAELDGEGAATLTIDITQEVSR